MTQANLDWLFIHAVARGETPGDRTPIAARLAVEIEQVDLAAGHIRLRQTLHPEDCNGNAVVQGGGVALALDMACAWATFAQLNEQDTIATLDFSLQFLEPVPPGPVTTEGRVIRLGGRSGFAEARLFRADGQEAARMQMTNRIIRGKA